MKINKVIMGPSNATILLLLCLPPDDDRMIETSRGNNIGTGEELLH
jgi:hypothetical protein